MNKFSDYPMGPNGSNDHFSPIHNGCAITGSTMSAGVLATSAGVLATSAGVLATSAGVLATSSSSLEFGPVFNGSRTMNVSDVNINGISLKETLQKIEQRLNILAPNKELEAQWEELQELGEKYRKLEKELESYNKVWEILSTDK
jgi:hypothetical protein